MRLWGWRWKWLAYKSQSHKGLLAPTMVYFPSYEAEEACEQLTTSLPDKLQNMTTSTSILAKEKLNRYFNQRLHPSSRRASYSARMRQAVLPPRASLLRLPALLPAPFPPGCQSSLPDVVVSPGDTWGTAASSQARAGNMAAAGAVSGKVVTALEGHCSFSPGSCLARRPAGEGCEGLSVSGTACRGCREDA